MKQVITVGLSVIVALCLCGQSLAGALPGLAKWMHTLVDDGQVVGCSAQVTQGGETIFLEAVGKRTPESDDALTTDQVVRIYSMSKAITSVAVMQLIEQGKLGIDDPVSMYIPEFADMMVGVGDAATNARRQITIRDLLTHTSGLAYDFTAPGPYKQAYEQIFVDAGTLKTAASAMGALPLVSEPGSGFVYGLSLDVLGRVIEVVSGESLGDYLQVALFEPLGMHDTGFEPSGDLEHMHIVTGDTGALKRDMDHYRAQRVRALKPRFESGGGGLWSTLHDYTQFMQAMEQYGALDDVRILKPKTVQFMTQNQLSPAFGSPQQFGLGFGLNAPVLTSRGPHGSGRWAWGGAACTYFFIDPKQDLTAMFITQKFPFDFVMSGEFDRAVLEAVAVADTTPSAAAH
jgi:CubicO group peptidase (beta-lactamase class C family)